MSSKESKFFITPFSGDDAAANEVYRESWRPSLMLELARQASPPHEHGLLGLAVTPGEYATYTATAFAVLDPPAEPPNGSDADTWARHNARKGAYERQEHAYKLAVGAILANLGTAAKELLRERVHRRYNCNLREIIEILDANFLPVTRQELLNAERTLDARYSTSVSFRAHSARQMKTHQKFAEAGQPLSELDKIRHLCTSVEDNQEVKPTIQLYFTNNPRLAEQHFADLSARIEAAFDNLHANPANEFANLSTSKIHPGMESLQLEIDRLRKENEHLRSANPRVKGRGNRREFSPAYCWTHGMCGHDGTQCCTPGVGHDKDAKVGDRKGGSERGVKRN